MSSYSPLTVRNSPIEFLIVGIDTRGEFRPLLLSENCGMDLIGYAASRSYLSKESSAEFFQPSILSVWRGVEEDYIPQSLYFEIFAEGKASPITFFWRGAKLEPAWEAEVRRIADINLNIIFSEIHRNGAANARQGAPAEAFFAWHISPIISYLHSVNRRRRRKHDFIKLFVLLYSVVIVFGISVAMLLFILRFLQ